MTAALAAGLYWQLLKAPNRAAELEAAAARFQERTGQVANIAQCHPGEAFEHPTIAVSESSAVCAGCLMVGHRAEPPRREHKHAPHSCTHVVHVDEMTHTHDIYIGRRNNRLGLPQSPFANPFRIGRDGTRDEVLARYRAWLLNRPDLMADIVQLHGRTLACFCAPPEGFRGRLLCHGQILAELAEAAFHA